MSKMSYLSHEQVLDELRAAGYTELAEDLDFYVNRRSLYRNEAPEIFAFTQAEADRLEAFPGEPPLDARLIMAKHTEWDVRTEAITGHNVPADVLARHADNDRNGNVRAHATDELLRRQAQLSQYELKRLSGWENNSTPCPVRRIEKAIQARDFDSVLKMGAMAVRRYVYWVWPNADMTPEEKRYRNIYTGSR